MTTSLLDLHLSDYISRQIHTHTDSQTSLLSTSKNDNEKKKNICKVHNCQVMKFKYEVEAVVVFSLWACYHVRIF